MLTVYSLPGAWGLPSLSPFCSKLIYFLDLAGLEYKIALGNMRKAPQGKVPYVDHNGTVLGDTHVIIPYLVAKTGKSLHEDLTLAQRAVGHAAMRVAEDSLYWVLVRSRWYREDGWSEFKPQVKKMLPPGIGNLLVHVLRRGALKQLHQVGVSRLTDDEIARRTERDLQAIQGLLGSQTFLTGDFVTVYDVAVWAVLDSILTPSYPSELKNQVQEHRPLVEWVGRLESERKTALDRRT